MLAHFIDGVANLRPKGLQCLRLFVFTQIEILIFSALSDHYISEPILSTSWGANLARATEYFFYFDLFAREIAARGVDRPSAIKARREKTSGTWGNLASESGQSLN